MLGARNYRHSNIWTNQQRVLIEVKSTPEIRQKNLNHRKVCDKLIKKAAPCPKLFQKGLALKNMKLTGQLSSKREITQTVIHKRSREKHPHAHCQHRKSSCNYTSRPRSIAMARRKFGSQPIWSAKHVRISRVALFLAETDEITEHSTYYCMAALTLCAVTLTYSRPRITPCWRFVSVKMICNWIRRRLYRRDEDTVGYGSRRTGTWQELCRD